MKNKSVLLMTVIVLLFNCVACGEKSQVSFTAEDFVSGRGEDSAYDEESYCEVMYYGDMAYATTECEDCKVAVELMVAYIYHEPDTENYLYMTTTVKSESSDFVKAVFEQENCCVLYAEAKHTIDSGKNEKTFETKAGELPK